MRLDAHERRIQFGPLRFEMLARAGPLGDDRRVKVERAELLAAEIRPCRKEVGKHLPVLVQPRARAGADAFLDRIVVVGVSDSTYRDYAERGAFVTSNGLSVTDARTLASQLGLLPG